MDGLTVLDALEYIDENYILSAQDHLGLAQPPVPGRRPRPLRRILLRTALAAALAASKVSPVRTISMYSLPNILTCSIFCFGVVTGMKMIP